MMRADNYRSGSRPLANLVTLLRVVAALTLLCALGGFPAAGQSRDGVKHDQAALHIQATIVSPVIHPDNRADNQHDVAINYNFQQSGLRLCVMEESRYVSIERERASGEQVILLRTTTVVPK